MSELSECHLFTTVLQVQSSLKQVSVSSSPANYKRFSIFITHNLLFRYKIGNPFYFVLSNINHELMILGIRRDRKSTRLNSSHVRISYAVFCLKTINRP